MALEISTSQSETAPTSGGFRVRGRWTTAFLLSAGIILAVTALAKIVSAFGDAAILRTDDQLLGIPLRVLLLIVALIEGFIAVLCFLPTRRLFQVEFIAWLTSLFALYRLGLVWIGYEKPCNCLGNLTDALHVSPVYADYVMKSALIFLLVGSYSILISNKLMKNPLSTGGSLSDTTAVL